MAAQTTRQRIRRRARFLYVEALVAAYFGAFAIAQDHMPVRLTETGYVPSPVPTPPAHQAADFGPGWPLLWGAIAVATVGAIAVLAVKRLAAAGEQLPALADPTRCPDCRQSYEAGDDVITPHYCDREVGF